MPNKAESKKDLYIIKKAAYAAFFYLVMFFSKNNAVLFELFY